MRTLPVIVVVHLLLVSICAAGERRYAFEKIQLNNGLTVISLEDFVSRGFTLLIFADRFIKSGQG